MTHITRNTQNMQRLLFAALAFGAFLLAGCFSTPLPDPPPPDPAALALRVGDQVKISFSGRSLVPPDQDDQVKEDGTINAPQIGPVQARGKTPLELQKDLAEKYQKLYKDLTVTVHSTRRLYSVGGEVRQNGRFEWTQDTTILKAIQSAGGFTDFANRKIVSIHRSDGRIDKVNCNRALTDPRHDVPIYPGDTIYVTRRGL
jgi:protein involved in polysaccharide export with SLBB domain